MLLKTLFAGLLLVASAGWSQAAQSFCTDDPQYPEPEDKGLVFYLQRTGNANTVVYAIRRHADGTINARDPVDIYWRFLAGDGSRGELKWYERQLAFGVHYAPMKGHPGKYIVRPNAKPEIEVPVEVTDEGEVRALVHINGQDVKLKCVYVEWRKQLGIIPRILYIDAYGVNLSNGDKVVVRVHP